jgi:hypothetical protein
VFSYCSTEFVSFVGMNSLTSGIERITRDPNDQGFFNFYSPCFTVPNLKVNVG